jgi:hypothetical protein
MSEIGKRIIIAPLDWGYGHATRMLTIVRWLSEKNTVYVAIPKSLEFFFVNENVNIISLPGLHIRFNRMPLLLSMFFQLPKILIRSFITRIVIKRAIKKVKANRIISDNHPLVFHKRIPSVYITHQLNIQHSNRLIKKAINFAHHRFIHRFNECWVPDTENGDLSGKLSQNKVKIPTKFIGGLSRFQTTTEIQAERFKKVCILSGPEPEKTRWANQMKRAWKNENDALIIGILSGKDRYKKDGELTLSSHLNDSLFLSILKQADVIVSRSGYSTIMDLAYLGKKGIFIPTKGQTEQEYLAGYYEHKEISPALRFISKSKLFEQIEDTLRF